VNNVRSDVYFPAAGFSNSLKSVGPALCPEFTYDDLEDIADGLAASAAFHQLASGGLIDAQDIDRVRSALHAYCQRDTLALVELHRALVANFSVLHRSRLDDPSTMK